MKCRFIIPKPINLVNFSEFGQVVLGARGKANYKGEDWKSLFPIAKLNLEEAELGWVKSKKSKGNLLIAGMEREPEVEIIIPTDAPLVHVVALSGNLDNHLEQPNADKAKAFIVYPGQILIMHPGTWHYTSFPYKNKEAYYYFITKDHPREKGWEDVVWVPFYRSEVIEVVLSKT